MEPLNIYLAEELSGVQLFSNNKINILNNRVNRLQKIVCEHEGTIIEKNIQLHRLEETIHQFQSDINLYQVTIQQLQADYAKLEVESSKQRLRLLRQNRFYKWLIDNTPISGRTGEGNIEDLNHRLSSSSRDEDPNEIWEQGTLE